MMAHPIFWLSTRPEMRVLRYQQGETIVEIHPSSKGPASDRRILVSSRAVERLYEVAPRWDKHLLESLYVEWAKSKDPARDEDARFIGWVRSYTKGKKTP
ncbi:MAG: hypothetical protein SH859_05495 [Hyphomicrobium aestuarii]|nr:hypothetical protein [Hyphomicrobium aestuarii]